MWVVGAHSKHHQVRVKPIQTVPQVGVIAGLRLLVSDEVHDLVFSLSRRFVARENDCNPLPQRVGRDFRSHEVLQLFVKPTHERRSRRDAVGIEPGLLWKLLTPVLGQVGSLIQFCSVGCLLFTSRVEARSCHVLIVLPWQHNFGLLKTHLGQSAIAH